MLTLGSHLFQSKKRLVILILHIPILLNDMCSLSLSLSLFFPLSLSGNGNNSHLTCKNFIACCKSGIPNTYGQLYVVCVYFNSYKCSMVWSCSFWQTKTGGHNPCCDFTLTPCGMVLTILELC